MLTELITGICTCSLNLAIELQTFPRQSRQHLWYRLWGRVGTVEVQIERQLVHIVLQRSCLLPLFAPPYGMIARLTNQNCSLAVIEVIRDSTYAPSLNCTIR